MRKVMHQVSVETRGAGEIVIGQEIHDMNGPDPEIVLSPHQVPLVTMWLNEAAAPEYEERDDPGDAVTVPARFFSRGPEAEAVDIRVIGNTQGMIALVIDDDTTIEVSPAMAKRLRDQLSRAIRGALTDLLRSDEES